MSNLKYLASFIIVLTLSINVGCLSKNIGDGDKPPSDNSDIVLSDTKTGDIALLLSVKEEEQNITVHFDGEIIIEKNGSIEKLNSDPQSVIDLIKKLEMIGSVYKTNQFNSDGISDLAGKEDMIYFSNLRGDIFYANLFNQSGVHPATIPRMLYEIDRFLRKSKLDQ